MVRAMSDRRAVRTIIDALVEGRGYAHWETPNRGPWSALLTPIGEDRGTPLIVNLSDDELVITVGLGSRIFLASSDPDEIERSLSILEAILDLGAKEFAGVDPDGLLRADVVVEGPFGSIDFPRANTILIGHIAPWEPRTAP